MASCPPCFAQGRERGAHRSDHPYRVIRDDFELLRSGWTARDELELADVLEEAGPSRWPEEAAARLKRTATQCRSHFEDVYVDNPPPGMPARAPSPETLYRPTPLTFRTGLSDPPRPAPSTAHQRDLAGYCAARGDFAVEMMQQAERDVASLADVCVDRDDADNGDDNDDNDDNDDDDDSLERALALAVVQVYNDKLRERARRKRVIIEHGLIHMHRHLAARFRYDATLTHRVCEKLSPLAQIANFDEYNALLEALHGHVELRRRISQLQKYRHLGLRTFPAAKLYGRHAQQRDKRLKQLKQFAANLNSQPQEQLVTLALDPAAAAAAASADGPASAATAALVVPQTSARRAAPPLDIVGLPGYDKLDAAEKQLCSVSRLVPESYLDFKRILVNECRQRQGIRLAQARTLIKIDVNKTRKIFDFLLDEKLIYPPAS